MKLIESKTLASAAASIEFTSIPQTFTDLVLLVSLRIDVPGPEFSWLRINGLTSNYSTRFLQGTGSSVASGADPAGTSYTWFGSIPGTAATSNTFSNAILYFPNYAGSTVKSWSVDSVMENNGTTSYQSISAHTNTTTNAITSILIDTDGGNFIAGSTISLYGITKGSDGIVTTS
jgi:hypothetical protein